MVEVSQARAAPVGLVAGTEDSTPLLFSVALAPEAYLQLDDVVVTVRAVPGVGPVLTSGIVTQVRARHEGASFASDVFLIGAAGVDLQAQEAKRNGGADAGHHQDPLGSQPGHAAMMRARWLEDVVLTALS